MNLSDPHTESTIRLLDIVYDIHGSDKGYPNENLPFTIGGDGTVTLSENLMTMLNKTGNQDLIHWATMHITRLF